MIDMGSYHNLRTFKGQLTVKHGTFIVFGITVIMEGSYVCRSLSYRLNLNTLMGRLDSQ